MHAPTTRRPADRDRAVDRIRRLTIGTTVAGIVAVGGFGGLAAATWHGTETTVTTAAVTSTGDDAASGSNTGSSAATDDDTSTTTDDVAATAPPTTSSTQATTPTVTANRGSAHATTGGS